VSSIEFGDDGVNAIPQLEQLSKRTLLIGDHPVNASPKRLLGQRAGASCLFDHAAKVAAISLGLKAKLASPHQLRQLADVRGDAPRLVAGEQLGPALLSPQCRSAKPTPMRPTITAATAAKKVHPTVNRY
jgi:hypothetical protein